MSAQCFVFEPHLSHPSSVVKKPSAHSTHSAWSVAVQSSISPTRHFCPPMSAATSSSQATHETLDTSVAAAAHPPSPTLILSSALSRSPKTSCALPTAPTTSLTGAPFFSRCCATLGRTTRLEPQRMTLHLRDDDVECVVCEADSPRRLQRRVLAYRETDGASFSGTAQRFVLEFFGKMSQQVLRVPRIGEKNQPWETIRAGVP